MRKRIIGIIAGAVMVLAGAEEVNAANGWEEELNGSGTSTSSSQTEASLQLTMGGKRVEGTLDAANAATNPDEAGKVLTEVATIVVGSTDGYTVAVSGNANLTGEKNSNHKIPSVTSAKTLGSMKNEWGYYGVLGDVEASWNPGTSFKGMSTSQQTVATGGATTSSVTKKVTLFYGARVDNTIAEDFYGNTVTLSVVAQPRTVTTTFATFDGETTMQGMTVEKCKKSNVHDTKQLTDTRDGKKYWVTRMLDGNCWMSQNLDLDIKFTSTSSWVTYSNIKAADSDVTYDWMDEAGTTDYPPRETVTSVTTGSTTNTETYSWNLGDYVIINPTATTACSSNNTGLSACSGQFMAVGSRTASTDPNFYQKNGATYTATEYDAHYLAGNYYQWNAATAGTGGSITNANATGSICPKGWKLPNSDYYDASWNIISAGEGSFTYLLQQYGVNSSLSGTSSVNSNTYDIALSPLFFVRGGFVDPGNSLSLAGQYGYYWSSRADSSTSSAYNFNFWGSGVDPSNSLVRYGGFSLRCLIPIS